MHKLRLVPFAWIQISCRDSYDRPRSASGFDQALVQRRPGLPMLARTNSASRTLSPAEISLDASAQIRRCPERAAPSMEIVCETPSKAGRAISLACLMCLAIRWGCARDLPGTKEHLLGKHRKTQAIGTSPSPLHRHAARCEFRIVLQRCHEKMHWTFHCYSPRYGLQNARADMPCGGKCHHDHSPRQRDSSAITRLVATLLRLKLLSL
jgi:hypothetical protein